MKTSYQILRNLHHHYHWNFCHVSYSHLILMTRLWIGCQYYLILETRKLKHNKTENESKVTCTVEMGIESRESNLRFHALNHYIVYHLDIGEKKQQQTVIDNGNSRHNSRRSDARAKDPTKWNVLANPSSSLPSVFQLPWHCSPACPLERKVKGVPSALSY